MKLYILTAYYDNQEVGENAFNATCIAKIYTSPDNAGKAMTEISVSDIMPLFEEYDVAENADVFTRYYTPYGKVWISTETNALFSVRLREHETED